jgi:hypothetical protein
MKKIFLQLAVIIILVSSCSKDRIIVDPDNPLLGTWIYDSYSDNAMIFTRSSSFTDSHCYRFNDGGTMVERKNAGWCGTPPITYADYEGEWSIISDTLIRVTVGYWGGVSANSIDIKLPDLNTLEMYYLPAD